MVTTSTLLALREEGECGTDWDEQESAIRKTTTPRAGKPTSKTQTKSSLVSRHTAPRPAL